MLALCGVLFLYAALAPLAKAIQVQDALWSGASIICRTMPASVDGAPTPAHGTSDLHDLSCCLPASRFDHLDEIPGCVPVVVAFTPTPPAGGAVPIPLETPSAGTQDLAARPVRGPPTLIC